MVVMVVVMAVLVVLVGEIDSEQDSWRPLQQSPAVCVPHVACRG